VRFGRLTTAGVLVASVASPAYAEVSDKVIPIPGILLCGVLAATAAFLACRYRPGLIWLALPLGLLFAAEGAATLQDRFVGPAIMQEAGVGYAIASYGSLALVVAASILGYRLGKQRTKSIE